MEELKAKIIEVLGEELECEKVNSVLQMIEDYLAIPNEQVGILKAEISAKEDVIARLTITNIIEKAVTKLHGRSVKTILPLLNLAVISSSDDPEAAALSAVAAIKQDPETAFLFEESTKVQGFVPADGSDRNFFASLSLEDAIRQNVRKTK